MNMLFRSFLFVLLLLKVQYSISQNVVADIELFNIADGLSQTTINVIFQDSRGFLWVGTQGGLNRYDGYNFKTFNPQVHKRYSISSNFITCIAEDNKGDLWVGTKNGLNKYVVKEDKFISYKHDSNNPLSIASDEIQGLLFDKKGNFWIKTPETIERFETFSGHFFHYPFFNNIFNFDNDRVNYPLLEDRTGKLWLGTKDGLNFLDRGLLLFDRYLHNDKKENWCSDVITSIIITQNNDFWVGTNNGLYLFDKAQRTFSQPAFMKPFKGTKIYALLVDYSGTVWIGSDKGLNCYNSQNRSILPLQLSDKSKSVLLKAQISSLYQDRSGIIWVGTNRGLVKANIQSKKFKLINKKTLKDELSSDDISSIYKEKNNLWLGTWGSGLNILDLTTNTLRKYNFSGIDGNSNVNFIHAIFKDHKGNYWLGTRDGVLNFNPNTGKASNICDGLNVKGCVIVKGNRISQIIEDNQQNLWLATYYGLLKYSSSRNDIKAWLYSPDDSSAMPSNINYCIKKDKAGFLWIGTDKGLVKFDPIAGKVLLKSHNPEQDKIMGNAIIYSMELDEANNSVWVGSENGLIRFDLNCNVKKVFTDNEYLSGNVIYSILKDNINNLWLSTNRGIIKYNITNEAVINYELSDGLQDYEYNLGASFKDREGAFYFGGISGLNIIKPDSVENSRTAPNIVVTNIEIIDKDGIRRNIKPKNNQINLPHGTNLLTLDFAALDFAYPYKNQYKYKFYSGDEPDWINLGNRHTATFTNLKPGKYTFKLTGSNSDLSWNPKGIVYHIIVESPFWLTSLAFYLYAIFAGILFFAIYQFRTLQFHKTSKLLKQQEIIATEMLRQKEELSVKNKNITDSINYAKRIQEALMPSEKQIKKAFPSSFVLLKPKDIVSGDFFWISERNDKVFVAAIDCTGHGVPGAFMSIIGYELFRKITNNQNIESAAEMLTLLNKEFEAIFKDVDNFTLRDGMDIAFVIIDKVKKKLEFSGAINPMYLIRNNKILEIRGSRFSIGIDEDEERDQIFESNRVDLEPDDIFYLFSDGYADQFGGPDGKKFKYRRFRHLLLTIHKFPMDEQLQLLEERLDSWKGEIEQVDDILIIGIKPTFKV